MDSFNIEKNKDIIEIINILSTFDDEKKKQALAMIKGLQAGLTLAQNENTVHKEAVPMSNKNILITEATG